MLPDNWWTILVFSFLLVAFINGLLASWTPFYYKNKSIGRLSHSQLRIKQGTANIEHRLNVFVQSVVFSFFNFRIYLLSFLLWLATSGAYYFFALSDK